MRPPFLSAALVVLIACGGGTTVSTPRPASRADGGAAVAADAVVSGSPLVPPEWGLAGRARATTGARAMVVSGHPLASEVGIEILKQGGNAIDAAVAVGFALEVVLPDAGNIGGGGFIVYRDTTGRVRALDYRETAPAGASRDMYLDSAGHVSERSLTGHLASGVPGSVAGMYEAWKKYGRRPWATLVAPAIRLAEGHMLDGVRSRDLEAEADRLRLFPASARQFLVEGHAPPAGAMFRQPDLAHTLQLIADSGPDVFYRGQIADSIVAEMRRGHGLITKSDLAGYRAKWRTPIQVTYRGYTIYSMPPASSGGVTMGEILNILEGYDTLPPFGSASYVHLETEAQRRAEIDPHKATPTPPFAAGGNEPLETTHYSVVDADGNAASVTTTLNGGFGSAVTVQGAGFLLNNEMDDFAAAPGQPNMYGLVQGEANAIAPKKRMLSAMTPSIVLDRDGKLFLVVGTPGGPTIITSVFQVIVNVVDFKMSLADAVGAPRIHHQALPDIIGYERNGLLPAVVDSLKAMGHEVRMRGGYSGDIAAIQRVGGRWVGVPDPRR